MIHGDKQRNALESLNATLVLARSMAYDNGSVELAEVLDVLEYLPRLLLADTDETLAFRQQLIGLSAKWPRFRLAVRRFDDENMPDRG